MYIYMYIYDISRPTVNELLSLSSFVQGDGSDSPRVLRSYPYTENL